MGTRVWYVVVGRCLLGLLLFAGLVVANACGPGGALGGLAPARADLTENALKSARYQLPDLGEFQLRDGAFEQKYGEGASQVNKVSFQTVAIGDLNGDRAGDAAVILWHTGGGSGTFVYLVAVANQNGAPQQVATDLLGDRVKIKALAVQDGKIVVEMVTFGPRDPRCCPSQGETRSYRLEQGALKR
ncbi:MAG: hypothetical protein HYY04_18880 [Chloroflexi bacterium]|nr:hypothetical protein [Chloroflexota bacterium]